MNCVHLGVFMKKQIIAAILTASLAGSAFTQTTDKTFLSINGKKISKDQFTNRLMSYPGLNGFLSGQYRQKATLASFALQGLTEEIILKQIASKKGLVPSKAQVKQQIEKLRKQNPQGFKSAKEAGITDAQIEQQIETMLIQKNLLTEGIKITPEKVEKYYKDNIGQFTKYKIVMVAAQDDKTKKEIDAELKKGTNFEDVAAKFAKGPAAANKGQLGELPKSAFRGPHAAIKDLKAGQATDWIKLGPSSSKYYVKSIKTDPLDAKLKERLKNQLEMQEGQKKNDVRKALKEAMKAAKISYNIGNAGIQKQFKNFLEEARKEDKKAAGAIMPKATEKKTSKATKK